MIGVADSSGATDDQMIQFITPLSNFREGVSDSMLVRPAFSDSTQFVDVTNTSMSPLTLFEIQINAPDVSADITLTSDPSDDIVLPPGATQRIHLTYAPSVPTLADRTLPQNGIERQAAPDRELEEFQDLHAELERPTARPCALDQAQDEQRHQSQRNESHHIPNMSDHQ